jgi:phosphatidylglycerophosphatase A
MYGKTDLHSLIMKERLIRLIASFFYIGNLPFIPGTLASLIGIGIYLLVKDNFIVYFFSIALIMIGGFFISGKAERISQQKDPSWIVLDEIGGMLLTLFLLPYKIKIIILGFIIFRFFDILKPFPLKRIQNLGGSLGIMLDDLLAAVYANLSLRIISRLVIV